MTAPTRRKPPTLRDRLTRLWKRLRGGELTPGRLGKSVALGLLIGVQPIYGLHLPLCVALALPLRLDLIATYLAANISIAPVAPFLLAVEVELGALLLTGHHAAFTVEQARSVGVSGFVAQALIGSVVLGLGLALLGGMATWTVARRLRRQTRLSEGIARTVARYAALRRADRGYVAVKLESDPVVGLLAAQTQLGRLVDAGAGRGQLGLLLLELGLCDTLTAFDWDRRKVEVAQRAVRGAARVERASLNAWDWEPANTILLVDVLHYLPAADQDEVLRRAADSLLPGGRLFVREVDAHRGLRSWVTTLAERVGTTLQYNRGAQLCFRSASQLRSVLTSHGLECEMCAAAEGTPLANVLIVARRPTQDHQD